MDFVLLLSRKCQNGYGANPIVSIHPEDKLANQSVFFGGVPDCVMSCHSPFFDPRDSNELIMETTLAVMTSFCMFCSVFTVAAFAMALKDYDYPEKPIMFFGFCYVMIGLGKLLHFSAPEAGC